MDRSPSSRASKECGFLFLCPIASYVVIAAGEGKVQFMFFVHSFVWGVFLASPTTHGSSGARDQTHTKVVTCTTAAAMQDP